MENVPSVPEFPEFPSVPEFHDKISGVCQGTN